MTAPAATTSDAPARGAVPEPFLEQWEPCAALVERDAYGDPFLNYRSIETAQGPHVVSRGRRMLLLASNNYLGLAGHPVMTARARAAVERYGTGVGGPQLLNGNTTLHQALETELAAFKGTEAAVVFSTGYQCNVGTIAALVGPGDLVLSDRLNHASILDGCRLSGASFRTFRHNDVAHLRRRLADGRGHRKKLVVVDGVYSMDGDLADLPGICDVARHHDALVMVDEAHATGIFGPTGRGVVEHFGVRDGVGVIMGTMSKAMASVGGFVAGSAALAGYLKYTARSHLFSAALPPAVVEAARAALELIDAEPWRRANLWSATTRLRDGLRGLGFDTRDSVAPLIPIVITDPNKAWAMAMSLDAAGIFVCAMFPPAVPTNLTRLRAHANAEHTPDDIDQAIAAFTDAGRELGLIP